MNTLPEENPHIFLNDGDAMDVYVQYNKADDQLEIENLVFSRSEALQIRDFINKYFGGSEKCEREECEHKREPSSRFCCAGCETNINRHPVGCERRIGK